MSQEVVGIDIKIGSNQAVKSIKDLREELSKTKEEVEKLTEAYGENSEQVKAKTQELEKIQSGINDKIENQNKAVENAGKTISALSAAYGGLQGALELTGLASDDVNKQLVKIQSAIAISDGIKNLIEFKDAIKSTFALFIKNITTSTIFQKANNVVTTIAISLQKAFGIATVQTATGFKILKGAIAATGIGLLAVVLGGLISKIQDWIGSTDDAKLSNEQLNEALEEQNRILDKNKQNLQQARENAIAEAKIKGSSAEEIFKINQEYSQKDIDLAKKNKAEKDKIIADFEKNLEKTTDKNGRTIVRGSEEEIEQYKKLKEEKLKADSDLAASQRKAVVETQQEQIRVAEDGRAKAKQIADKRKADNEKELQERIAANEQAEQQLKKIREDAELNAIEDQNKRAIRQAEIDFENRKLEIEALKASEKLKTQLLVQAQKDRDKQIADAKAAAEQAEFDAIFERLEKERELEDIEKKRIADAQQKEFDDLFAQLEAENEAERKAAEAQKQIDAEKEEFRRSQLNETADALGKLGEIVGKETAAGKALAVAQALINTYQGATEALKQKSTLPSPFDFAAKAINVAAIIGSGLKAVRAITAVKVPGGGGGQSAPLSTISSGGAAPIAPASPQAALTQLDQVTINRLGSASNRAYVVESDITNSQERITRINRAARLG